SSLFSFLFSLLSSLFSLLSSLFPIPYSLFSILYSLFSILYSLFSILYSLFSILYSPSGRRGRGTNRELCERSSANVSGPKKVLFLLLFSRVSCLGPEGI